MTNIKPIKIPIMYKDVDITEIINKHNKALADKDKKIKSLQNRIDNPKATIKMYKRIAKKEEYMPTICR